MSESPELCAQGMVWSVGALCRAIADALQARFNPLQVRGELTGFTRASSGHCYFTLKDANGQLRCAMFKRAAVELDFMPRDGELLEVQGRLGVYEPRGELQLIVERMRRCGQGTLYEEFLQRKARLQAQGLLDAQRKRILPVMPKAIGVVTSLTAAAWHDVVITLQRRVPHIPVLMVPASVQGVNAPAELIEALSKMYRLAQDGQASEPDLSTDSQVLARVEVILLVRGGGSIEDLWAFNDEALARVIASSPVPLISGVGHETDFTLADFVADVRAPTPTAAAELVAQPRALWYEALALSARRMDAAMQRRVERSAQSLDAIRARLGRPSARLTQQRLGLAARAQRLQMALALRLKWHAQQLQHGSAQWPLALQQALQKHHQRLDRAALRLELLDPGLVLARGYAWLSDQQGQTLSHCRQFEAGQSVQAILVDGTVDLTVNHPLG